jgi:D-alanine-D-alanine ligase
MTLVKNEEEFPSALGFAADYGTEVLIERYIPGRELTVAVLEGNPLPVVEIKPDKGLYDYRSKYSTGGSKYSVPAEVSPEIVSGMSDDALAAFGLLGCSTYGRVDFRLDPEGVWYILEVNTLPGMTATSLVPMAARAAGMEFSELVLRIVGTGMSGSV